MSEPSNESPSNESPPNLDSFGHRHGATIIMAVLFGLLGLVMVIQMAC